MGNKWSPGCGCCASCSSHREVWLRLVPHVSSFTVSGFPSSPIDLSQFNGTYNISDPGSPASGFSVADAVCLDPPYTDHVIASQKWMYWKNTTDGSSNYICASTKYEVYFSLGVAGSCFTNTPEYAAAMNLAYGVRDESGTSVVLRSFQWSIDRTTTNPATLPGDLSPGVDPASDDDSAYLDLVNIVSVTLNS